MEDTEIKAIVDAALRRSESLVKADTAAIRSQCTERFTYTNASGCIFDLEEYLDFYIASGRMRWQSQRLEDVNVVSYGDAAVLTCRVIDCASFDGESFEGNYRSTQVWVRRSGQWLCAAIQTTEIAK